MQIYSRMKTELVLSYTSLSKHFAEQILRRIYIFFIIMITVIERLAVGLNLMAVQNEHMALQAF